MAQTQNRLHPLKWWDGSKEREAMSQKEIPLYRCTYCCQAIPKDHDQNLIGSYGTRPESDDASNFIIEAQTITKYASAVAVMYQDAREISEEVLSQLHFLINDLMEESLRRLRRAQDALDIVWKREEAAKQANPTCKEGRA
jgi:hypothetical protein